MEMVMGYVKVATKIGNPADRSKSIRLDLLADTGAIYTAIPASLLEKISIRAEVHEEVQACERQSGTISNR